MAATVIASRGERRMQEAQGRRLPHRIRENMSEVNDCMTVFVIKIEDGWKGCWERRR